MCSCTLSCVWNLLGVSADSRASKVVPIGIRWSFFNLSDLQPVSVCMDLAVYQTCCLLVTQHGAGMKCFGLGRADTVYLLTCVQ